MKLQKLHTHLILLAALLLSTSLFAGDSLNIGEAPISSPGYFWTFDGMKSLVVDKNLSGNQIKIGGVPFEKGVCGHTSFTEVWNLSGLASSFECKLGVEDEDNPKDKIDEKPVSIRFRVVVDRNVVFDEIRSLGQEPLPVSVDLRGASQIELRADNGSGSFTRQRAAFGDAVLKLDCGKEEFLKSSSEWAKRIKDQMNVKIASPEPPSWKGIKVEKVKFRNFEEAWRFDTGACELIVVPEFGGMILSYSLPGGKNIITPLKNELDDGSKERTRCPDRGGHFNRFQPLMHCFPPEPLFLVGAFSLSFPEEGVAELKSQDSWYLLMRQEYVIKMKPGSSEVQVTNRQVNIGKRPQLAGIWSITRTDSAILKEVSMPSEMANAPVPAKIAPEFIKSEIVSANGWDSVEVDKAFFERLGRSALEWYQWPSKGVIRAKFEGCEFTKSFPADPKDAPDMGAFQPAHIYIHKLFTELECHSPTRLVKPGEAAELIETWTLTPSPADSQAK